LSRTAWIALSLVERVGNKTLHALLEYFDGDLESVFDAEASELQRIPGIGPKLAQSIYAVDLEQVESYLMDWESLGVQVLTLDDENYPSILRAVAAAPATLFVRGTLAFGQAVAIVGTRSPSDNARDLAHKTGVDAVRKGSTVVSGLARGIDTTAHLGALSTEGHTIAVLGSGVCNIYPPENEALANRILERGALVSEVAPYDGPSSARLVARNRIISGLSNQVIVVETSTDGGAMHAAKRAREQGRTIYTFDLPISGNQQLIAEGAEILHKGNNL
jgi:DNA processing protein